MNEPSIHLEIRPSGWPTESQEQKVTHVSDPRWGHLEDVTGEGRIDILRKAQGLP
jgi:hypothetical protein